MIEEEKQKMIDEGYLEGKKSFEYYKNDIAENFKFERVHQAMVALGWEWYFGKDEFGMDKMGVPSLSTIKNYAYGYIKEAYEKGTSTGSGGFMAGWDGDQLYLVFNLEEYSG